MTREVFAGRQKQAAVPRRLDLGTVVTPAQQPATGRAHRANQQQPRESFPCPGLGCRRQAGELESAGEAGEGSRRKGRVVSG